MLPRATTQRACYFPSGTRAPDSWTACNATADDSHCCLATDICLDNSYCYAQDDGTGHSSYVNRVTRGALYGEGAKSIALVQDLEFGMFCCGHGDYFYNGTHCASPTHGNASAFILPPGRAIHDRLNGNTSTSATSEGGGDCTHIPADSPSASCATTAVGVGVAVPLGVLLLLAIAWALHLRHKINLLSQQPPIPPQDMAKKHSSHFPKMGGDRPEIPEAGGVPLVEVSSDVRLPELDARNEK
ncbi:hypothetical protein Q7P37_000652 [Cladosporium fusiforme]